MAKEQWPTWNLYVEYRCQCAYCDFEGRSQNAWWLFDRDHLVPTALGGRLDDPLNWVLACSGCNRAKGDWDPRGNNERDQTLTQESKPRWISNVRDFIRTRRGLWVEDFQRMLAEIDERR